MCYQSRTYVILNHIAHLQFVRPRCPLPTVSGYPTSSRIDHQVHLARWLPLYRRVCILVIIPSEKFDCSISGSPKSCPVTIFDLIQGDIELLHRLTLPSKFICSCLYFNSTFVILIVIDMPRKLCLSLLLLNAFGICVSQIINICAGTLLEESGC